MNGLQNFMPEAASVRVFPSDSLLFFFLVLINFAHIERQSSYFSSETTFSWNCWVVESWAECFLRHCHMFAGSFLFCSTSCAVAIFLLSGHSSGSSGQFFEVSHTFCSAETEQSCCMCGATEVQEDLSNWVFREDSVQLESKWQKRSWRLDENGEKVGRKGGKESSL